MALPSSAANYFRLRKQSPLCPISSTCCGNVANICSNLKSLWLNTLENYRYDLCSTLAETYGIYYNSSLPMMHKLIHIIDDDMDILTILQMFFKKKGFDVVADYNGNHLDLAYDPCPEIYLIDINLIGRNGVDLCRLIKKDCHHRPVILMSANSDLEILARDCDADAFVAKPFDMQQILKTVNRLVA